MGGVRLVLGRGSELLVFLSLTDWQYMSDLPFVLKRLEMLPVKIPRFLASLQPPLNDR